jgi:disulfide oxidoreductase YuzD
MKPDDDGRSIAAILDDLYANELNVALSWNHERGLHATLGNPSLAESSFPTSGEAVRWLAHEALRHFPDIEFRAECSHRARRDQILDQLCASDIAGSISWIWDGGFYAVIGDPKRAEKWWASSAGAALDWLRDQAIRIYPGREFNDPP